MIYRVSQKLALGFLPLYGLPCPSWAIGLLNILEGSYIKISSCQVTLQVFHIFLSNFDL